MKRHLRVFALASILTLALCVPAHATKFSQNFAEFELPSGWSCALEGQAWQCQTSDEAHQADAVMVLAAKRKGSSDSLAAYQDLLGKPRHGRTQDGEEFDSKVTYVKSTEIAGQVWVDALHSDSEIPGYFTRYIATIKDNVAVLITYSIEKSKYQQYLPQFEALVRSVKVFKEGTPLPVASATPDQPNQQTAQNTTHPASNVLPSSAIASKEPAPVQKLHNVTAQESGGGLLLLLVLGAGGYFIYKKKKSATG